MIGLYLYSFSFLAWILRCDFRMRWKKLKGVLRVYISIKHGAVLKWTFAMTFVLLDYALWLTYFKSFVPFHVERLARSIVFGLLMQARPCTPSWFLGKWHLRRCLSASNWTFEDLSSTGEEKYSVSGFLENRRTRIDVTTDCCFAGAIQEGRITCIDITKNAVSKTQLRKDKALQYQLIGYWCNINVLCFLRV